MILPCIIFVDDIFLIGVQEEIDEKLVRDVVTCFGNTRLLFK